MTIFKNELQIMLSCRSFLYILDTISYAVNVSSQPVIFVFILIKSSIFYLRVHDFCAFSDKLLPVLIQQRNWPMFYLRAFRLISNVTPGKTGGLFSKVTSPSRKLQFHFLL